jgi:hypothetical protein
MEQQSRHGSAHWDAHAARWRLIGAPLRRQRQTSNI